MPPFEKLREWLPLPGPRSLWWTVSLVACALPLVSQLQSEPGPGPDSAYGALRMEIRLGSLEALKPGAVGEGADKDGRRAPAAIETSPQAPSDPVTATGAPAAVDPLAVTALPDAASVAGAGVAGAGAAGAGTVPATPSAATLAGLPTAVAMPGDATGGDMGVMAELGAPVAATIALAVAPTVLTEAAGTEAAGTEATETAGPVEVRHEDDDGPALRARRGADRFDAALVEATFAQLRQWHERALRLEERSPSLGRLARGEVIAAAVARGMPQLAATFASVGSAEALDEDARAALAACGSAAPPAALALVDAVGRARRERFGHAWSNVVRERVRARLGHLAGDAPLSRAAHDRLFELEDTVLMPVTTLSAMGSLALMVGIVAWAWLLTLGLMARRRGEGFWATLQARIGAGLPIPHWPRDPLLPWLGVGTWLAGTLLAGLLMALLPSARDGGGLAMLFQGCAGVLVAWALVSAFARTGSPAESAGLLGDDDAGGAWRGSTSALLGFCLLLPVVGLAALIQLQLPGGPDPEAGDSLHPVANLLLEDGSGLQIAALGLAVVVAAPIGEELIFRAFFARVLRGLYGARIALLVSTTAFAALHLAPQLFLPYVVLGLAFGLALEITGNLWTCIFLHALWNCSVFAALVLVSRL